LKAQWLTSLRHLLHKDFVDCFQFVGYTGKIIYPHLETDLVNVRNILFNDRRSSEKRELTYFADGDINSRRGCLVGCTRAMREIFMIW
jgi:hypothetical protein